MKQCPICKTTYTDDSLSFCLSDGATLLAVSDEEETRLLNNPLRINVSPETTPVFTPPIASGQTAQDAGKSKTVSLLIGLLALVILLFIGFAAFMLLKPSDDKNKNSSPTPTASQTPDPKIANLEKQIGDLKNQKSLTPVPLQSPRATSARVDSPNDGFLALRSAPSAEIGYQILKIPHGASVNVIDCQGTLARPGKRTGRWCRVNYDGHDGWAFDGYLSY